jgi:hypothetical protein
MTLRPSPCAVLGAAAIFPAADEPLAALLPKDAPAGRAEKLQRADRLCGLAACAVERALAAAPLCADPAWQPETTGVLLGSSHGCHKTDELYLKSVLDGQPSPRLFAYTLPSSPIGEISILHGLLGPGLAVVSGRSAGMEALAEAQALLERGPTTASIVVAVEVADPAWPAEPLHDAAVALILAPVGSPLAYAAPGIGHVVATSSAFFDGDPVAAAKRAVTEACGLPELVLGRTTPLVCDAETARCLDGALGEVAIVQAPPCGAVHGPWALLALGGAPAAGALAPPIGALPDAPRTLVLSVEPSGQAACALFVRPASPG